MHILKAFLSYLTCARAETKGMINRRLFMFTCFQEKNPTYISSQPPFKLELEILDVPWLGVLPCFFFSLRSCKMKTFLYIDRSHTSPWLVAYGERMWHQCKNPFWEKNNNIRTPLSTAFYNKVINQPLQSLMFCAKSVHISRFLEISWMEKESTGMHQKLNNKT